MKRRVCKKCKIFVKGEICPVCSRSDLSEIWNGRLFVLNAEKSEIARNIGIKVKGEYAIKVR